MDDDIDLIGADAEEPAGFDDLKALVDHRGGVDGDAVAHAPVGMSESLGGSDGFEGLERRFAERATGGGEDDAANLGVGSGAETLVDGVVFTVDGEEFPAGFGGSGHNEFTSGNKDFFVGKSDGAAEFDGFVGGFESNDTDGGGNDNVGVRMSADGEHALASMMDGGESDSLFAKAAGEFVGELRSGDGNKFRMVALDLRKEFIKIGAGGEGEDLELAGERFDDGEGLAADGAGRTEDGEGFHEVSFQLYVFSRQ